MPELPETETIARDLHREIRGRTIVDVVVRRADVLREVDAIALAYRATGVRIERCWRRAKLVVVDLSTTDRLVVQPRFTGALLLARGPLPPREATYSTLHFTLDDGRDLHYRDIRRLGTVSLMDEERFASYSGGLGVEPLDPAFSVEHLSVLLRGSRQAVKKVLMDQRVVAGLGNIYANEACWRAGVDHHARHAPSAPTRSPSSTRESRACSPNPSMHAARRSATISTPRVSGATSRVRSPCTAEEDHPALAARPLSLKHT